MVVDIVLCETGTTPAMGCVWLGETGTTPASGKSAEMGACGVAGVVWVSFGDRAMHAGEVWVSWGGGMT